MTTVVIDGVEYVPRTGVPPLTDARLRAALQSLTEIQYFSECRHKHRAWGWDALNALAPEVAALAADNPQAAFDSVRGDERDVGGKSAPQLVLHRPNEETLQVLLGEDVLVTLTHDEHGWAGMAAAEQLVTQLTKALGLSWAA